MNLNNKNPLEDIIKFDTKFDRIEGYCQYWAQKSPNEIAAIDGENSFTYQELARLSDNMAQFYIENEIKTGDKIAILAPPSIDFLVSFLASCKIGAVWIGLNPKYQFSEMEFILRDAAPKLLLFKRQISNRDYSKEISDFENSDLFNFMKVAEFGSIKTKTCFKKQIEISNPIAALVYTSGTTGKPKGAKIPHKALIDGALTRLCVWNINPFRTINNVPINHIGGLGDIAITTLIKGGTQVFLETFSAKNTLKIVSKHEISLWYQAPTMFEMCLNDELIESLDLSKLQAIVWSGGRASLPLINLMLEFAPLIGVDYSMTESVGAICLSKLTNDANEVCDNVGWPIPHRNFKISPLNEASLNEGEARIKDDFMFSGYVSMFPKKREVALRQETMKINDDAFDEESFFKTGDIVKCFENGKWQITGRAKEMFKSGGYNVYPKEIEQVLEAHENIQSAAIVPIDDRVFLEIGIAFVTFKNSAPAPDLKAYCAKYLANYKIPKAFIKLDEMPMLPIGKIDKMALKKMALEIPRPI